MMLNVHYTISLCKKSVLSGEFVEQFLELSSLRKTYRTPEGGEVIALDDFSLSIRNNEFLTLLGPSGCGKTTLLKCIAGFEDIDHGDIFLEGTSVKSKPAYRRPFNTVFQNYALFPHLSVSNNVGYGLDVSGVKGKERKKRVQEALELVGLDDFGSREPHQLSGGQQQRVALARSLVLRPRVLLLDEPLSALDRKLRESMRIELKSLKDSVGITFIFVTHDQEEALAMSDRIAVVDGGRLQQLGTPSEIYDEPNNPFVAEFVGASNIFSGIVTERSEDCVTIQTDNERQLIAISNEVNLGERVHLVLRPEHFTLTPVAGVSNTEYLSGKINQSVFVGSDMHLHVDVGKGRMATVHHRHQKGGLDETFDPGTEIKLYYLPSACHLIRDKV